MQPPTSGRLACPAITRGWRLCPVNTARRITHLRVVAGGLRGRGREPLDPSIDRRHHRFMRSTGPPLSPVLRSRVQLDLLAWLLLHPDQEFSLTDIAGRIGAAQSIVHAEGGWLEEARDRHEPHGRPIPARTSQSGGRPDPTLAELVVRGAGPHLVIGDELGRVQGVDLLIVHGSWAARYDGEHGPPPRDIDVLDIGRPGRIQLYEAVDAAAARLRLPVNPVSAVLSAGGPAATHLSPKCSPVRTTSSLT